MNLCFNQKQKSFKNVKKKLLIESEDFDFYKKNNVFSPTWCPECRLIRRMTWRNERTLYKRKCDLCRKEIISIYSPNENLTVYCNECWYSDKWDPLAFGKNYDFSFPFFKQFEELIKKVPLLAINNFKSINSLYTNFAAENKDCFLLISAVYNENCAYGNRIFNSKDCFDCYDISKNYFCYECFKVEDSYNSAYLTNSEAIINSVFCYDCKNVSDCIGCVNLRNKNYFIFNQSYSKERFLEKKKNEFDLGSYHWLSNFKHQFSSFSLKFPRRYALVIKSFNSAGDNIYNLKNVKDSFYIYESENLKYVQIGWKLKDIMDVSFDDESQLGYEIMSGQSYFHCFLILQIWWSQYVQYSFFTINSSNLFGCVGLRNKQYCILNKQYTKEEYEKLVPKIIEHMNNMPYIDKKGRV